MTRKHKRSKLESEVTAGYKRFPEKRGLPMPTKWSKRAVKPNGLHERPGATTQKDTYDK